MLILVNGETREVPDRYSVAELLLAMQLQQKRLAVEVNEQIVPRSQHERHALQAQDRVEIVHAIGGG